MSQVFQADRMGEESVVNSLDFQQIIGNGNPQHNDASVKTSWLSRNSQINRSKTIAQIQRGIIYGKQYNQSNKSQSKQNSNLNMKVSRSLKINCSGQSAIVNDQHDLDCQYFPSKYKKEGKSSIQSTQLLRKERNAKSYSQNCKEFYNNKIKPLVSFNNKEKEEEDSIEVEERKIRRLNFIFTFILLSILLSLLIFIYHPGANRFFHQTILETYKPYSINLFPLQP